ncbi:MAG: tRNA 2-selenouridine(34) synthase MnmH [Verrucomicrobiota bacterium]
MNRHLISVSWPPRAGEFDEIVDVRAPGEFAEDHISGAINLPVLDDAERVTIGTIYKQRSAFEARKQGAAIVSRHIGEFLETHFAGKGKDYRPLVYCWRGGQRSGSLATVLADVGWSVGQLEGGYRNYRTAVLETLQARGASLPFVVLNGYTGAGKTAILQRLHEAGEQVLDLESAASHKGSVFGGDSRNPQPAQKRFESLLYDAVAPMNSNRPVFVEAESAKIGRLNLPNPIWQRLKGAPVIEIDSPVASRAAHILSEYRDWLDDLERIDETIDRLHRYHSTQKRSEWKALAAAGRWEAFTESLLSEHYDQHYRIGGKGNYEAPRKIITLPNPSEERLLAATSQISEFGRALITDKKPSLISGD